MEGRRAPRALIVAAVLLAAPALLPSAFAAGPSGAGRQVHQCVFDRTMLWTAPGTCRPKALHYPADVENTVERSIYDSALTFGVPYNLLLSLARCESALNPRASDGEHLGLFQFLLSTFREGALRMQAETGIGARSVWNPRDSAYVAGYLFAVGSATSWSCLSQVAAG